MEIVERGIVPCRVCRQPHHARAYPPVNSTTPVTWADDDGHAYVRMTAEEVIEFLAASERPPVDPLRGAAQAVLDELDIIRSHRDDMGLPRILVHPNTHEALRAALAAAPRPEGLDVIREMSRFLQTAWTEADHATDGQPVTAFYDDLARRVVSAFLLPEGLDVIRDLAKWKLHGEGGVENGFVRVRRDELDALRSIRRRAREYARLSSSVVTVNDDGTADVAEAS